MLESDLEGKKAEVDKILISVVHEYKIELCLRGMESEWDEVLLVVTSVKTAVGSESETLLCILKANALPALVVDPALDPLFMQVGSESETLVVNETVELVLEVVDHQQAECHKLQVRTMLLLLLLLLLLLPVLL